MEARGRLMALKGSSPLQRAERWSTTLVMLNCSWCDVVFGGHCPFSTTAVFQRVLAICETHAVALFSCSHVPEFQLLAPDLDLFLFTVFEKLSFVPVKFFQHRLMTVFVP